MTRPDPLTMRWPLAVGIALTLGLTVGAGPGFAQSPAPSGGPAPSATPAPSVAPSPSAASTAPAPSAEPSPSGGIMPVAPEGGLLVAGTHVTQAVGPTITFEVGDGWVAAPESAGIGFALLRAGAVAPALISFTEFEGLVFQDPCLATTDETLEIDVTPEAIALDLAGNPNLIATDPVETVVSGFPGLIVDVATLQPTTCEQLTVWIWAMRDGGGFLLQEGQQARFYLVDVDGRVLVFAIETFPGTDHDRFLDEAVAVVDSIVIDPATTAATPPPPPSPGASPEPGPLVTPGPPVSLPTDGPDGVFHRM